MGCRAGQGRAKHQVGREGRPGAPGNPQRRQRAGGVGIRGAFCASRLLPPTPHARLGLAEAPCPSPRVVQRGFVLGVERIFLNFPVGAGGGGLFLDPLQSQTPSVGQGRGGGASFMAFPEFQLRPQSQPLPRQSFFKREVPASSPAAAW